MSITPSHRPSREWFWLVLAFIVVGAVAIPLWIIASPAESTAEYWKKNWNPTRVARLLLGPEQIGCYLCFTWASFMLMHRYREVQRQRQAFQLDILPTEPGARILPEDARPLTRKLEAVTRGRPFILAKLIQMGLGKYAISRKATDVGEVVRTQAEVEQNRLATSMSLVNYLVWAIPAIGFLGTVRGLAGGLSNFQNVNPSDRAANKQLMEVVTRELGVAFDCTFVALSLSVVLMLILHYVQKVEEMLIIDSQQYCQEHLLLRLYDPQPEAVEAL